MISSEEIRKILKFVKKEPRTVQEISKLIGKSWVTTDNYLKRIKDDTGLINIKTFRKGSQGALKIVYFSTSESLQADEIQEDLFQRIKTSSKKQDFEFFDVFQYVPDKKKKLFYLEYNDDQYKSEKQNLIPFLRQAENSVYIFSGNLSFINLVENKSKVLSVFEELARRKVFIKIICRVNVSSMNNISQMSGLLSKYPGLIEIKHKYQPLRGFIIDDKVAKFKSEEILKDYKPGELSRNLRIFYEIYDTEWIQWLQKVFWNLYRSSIEYSERTRIIRKYF